MAHSQAGGANILVTSSPNFVKEFCKITSEKKAWRDNVAKKQHRKGQASSYYEATTTEFIVTPRTMDELTLRVTTAEAVGIILIHQCILTIM